MRGHDMVLTVVPHKPLAFQISHAQRHSLRRSVAAVPAQTGLSTLDLCQHLQLPLQLQ